MQYSSFGTTINAGAIVESITSHGSPVFHVSEVHLKPFLCKKSACNLADIMAVFRRSCRYYLVGIEIKEWNAPVNAKLAMEYLDTYRNTCEYFYLAAKQFSKTTFDIKELGLFDLNELKVIKEPSYLFPDPDFRGHLMKRLRKQYQVLYDAVDDPYQRTLLEFPVLK